MWAQDLQSLLTLNKIKSKDLESLIGRLNNVGFIIPHSRYFLNRLRWMLNRCERFGPQPWSKPTKADATLWRHFLEQAGQGININLITYTAYDSVLFTDACEIRLGGFSVSTGKAWRYKLPDWATHLHINALEFLAAYIGIYLELTTSPHPYHRILCMTDNSSALAWLHKANFQPNDQTLHETIARRLARTMVSYSSALYSQHIPGKQNFIADSLSRDHQIPHDKLFFLLSFLFPHQTGETFQISDAPPAELTSWINSLQGASTRSKKSQQAPTKSNLGSLINGNSTWNDVKSKVHSWTTSPTTNESASSPALQALYDEISLDQQKSQFWLDAPLRPPLTTYARPLGRTFGQTLF